MFAFRTFYQVMEWEPSPEMHAISNKVLLGDVKNKLFQSEMFLQALKTFLQNHPKSPVSD